MTPQEEWQGTRELIETIQRNAAAVELRMLREIEIYKNALRKITKLKRSGTLGPIASYYTLQHTAATALLDGTRVIEEDWLGW